MNGARSSVGFDRGLSSANLIPSMMARKHGKIINIASIAGKEGTASHYSAAKAGVIGLTKSLGKELATSGVRCIASLRQ